MPTVAEVMRRHGTAYLERFHAAMPAEHKKVLQTIMACRTGQLGTVLYRCTSCGRQHVMGRSCGNRHCPTCQQDKTRAWLQTQTDRLLPCPYFLMTFTVPAALRLDPQSSRIAYAPCSRRPARRSKPWRPIPSMWEPRNLVSSACCTRGGALWTITPMFITSCPAAASVPTAGHGCHPVPSSSWQSVRCRSCFEPSSATLSRVPGC